MNFFLEFLENARNGNEGDGFEYSNVIEERRDAAAEEPDLGAAFYHQMNELLFQTVRERKKGHVFLALERLAEPVRRREDHVDGVARDVVLYECAFRFSCRSARVENQEKIFRPRTIDFIRANLP